MALTLSKNLIIIKPSIHPSFVARRYVLPDRVCASVGRRRASLRAPNSFFPLFDAYTDKNITRSLLASCRAERVRSLCVRTGIDLELAGWPSRPATPKSFLPIIIVWGTQLKFSNYHFFGAPSWNIWAGHLPIFYVGVLLVELTNWLIDMMQCNCFF